MKLLSDNEIKFMSVFREINEYNDKNINNIYNNCVFLYENYDFLCKSGISPETVLYSEYYWEELFIRTYQKEYNTYSGYEQFHFKLIDCIEHTTGNVDISLLENIESEVSDIVRFYGDI